MQNDDAQNIIFTGFMGTGKTTVGKMLAKKLGREFIDTDDLIEKRQGLTIPEIFDQLGEVAFREMEAEIAKELGQSKGLVISTGGRLMLDPANVEALSVNGRVFCLVATPQEILSRIEGDTDHHRPLLDVPNPGEQIVELLQERKKGYQRFLKMTTDEKHPGDITADLLDFMQKSQKHIAVEIPSYPHEYIVGNGILPFTRQLAGIDGMLVVITDSVAGELYAHSCGSIDHVITIPEGRQKKTLATVQAVYDELVEIGFDRSGTIMALGGSVIGDIAGFVAATYMRGVNLVQCPTSLLAMADTSIGGKNSLDLPQGKNLIGSFKQPSLVIADVATLNTLPKEELISGMAEIIKHGLLADTDLLGKVEQGTWPLRTESLHTSYSELQSLVAQSIQVKISYVQKDPFDEGIRKQLNMGHTFAHAIEKVSSNTIRHGEAVAMGIAAATDLSVRLGHCDEQLKHRIDLVLEKVGLPNRIPDTLSPESIFETMKRDKKRRAQSLRLVLPLRVGQVFVADDIDSRDVLKTLEAMSSPAG
ncbi:MAG: 3-dehydroquinate synthase [Desulfofustis sp.]|nr:3-dehydroquinate synthase [Desulfofustis sp.]